MSKRRTAKAKVVHKISSGGVPIKTTKHSHHAKSHSTIKVGFKGAPMKKG